MIKLMIAIRVSKRRSLPTRQNLLLLWMVIQPMSIRCWLYWNRMYWKLKRTTWHLIIVAGFQDRVIAQCIRCGRIQSMSQR
jgi:hypothetical protein